MVIAVIAVIDQSFTRPTSSSSSSSSHQESSSSSSQAAQQHARWGMAGSLWPHRLLSNVHAGRIHRPTGPSLTRRVCHRRKKKRKRERLLVALPVRPPAGGCSSRTRAGALDKGGREVAGVLLGGQGRQKTLHPPGSLHSCPSQKLHLSICSNLNGPGHGPLLTVSPRRRCQQPIRRCDSSILDFSLLVPEGL